MPLAAFLRSGNADSLILRYTHCSATTRARAGSADDILVVSQSRMHQPVELVIALLAAEMQLAQWGALDLAKAQREGILLAFE